MVFVFPSEPDSMKVSYEFEKTYNKLESMGYKVYTMNINTAKGLKLHPDISDKSEKIALYTHDMSVEYYKEIYSMFLDKGLKLINTPEEYDRTHYFKESNFRRFGKGTPEFFEIRLEEKDVKRGNKLVKGLSEASISELYSLRNVPYRYVIKDEVKKLYGYKFPDFFDSTYSSGELENFIMESEKYHPDRYYGKYIVKKYLRLKQYQDESTLLSLGSHKYEFNELRLWVIDGKVEFITDRTKGEIANKTPVSKAYLKRLPKFNSNFYTIDIAEVLNKDGSIYWTVLDLNDGQVSHLNTKRVITSEEFDTVLIDDDKKPKKCNSNLIEDILSLGEEIKKMGGKLDEDEGAESELKDIEAKTDIKKDTKTKSKLNTKTKSIKKVYHKKKRKYNL